MEEIICMLPEMQRNADPMLVYCRASIPDDGPAIIKGFVFAGYNLQLISLDVSKHCFPNGYFIIFVIAVNYLIARIDI